MDPICAIGSVVSIFALVGDVTRITIGASKLFDRQVTRLNSL